jgi:hypothetical protein
MKAVLSMDHRRMHSTCSTEVRWSFRASRHYDLNILKYLPKQGNRANRNPIYICWHRICVQDSQYLLFLSLILATFYGCHANYFTGSTQTYSEESLLHAIYHMHGDNKLLLACQYFALFWQPCHGHASP